MDNYLKEKEGLTRAQCAYYRQVEETCKRPTKNKVFSSTEGRRCLSLPDSNYGMPVQVYKMEKAQRLVDTDISESCGPCLLSPSSTVWSHGLSQNQTLVLRAGM